jgi:hypothetical protein
MDLKMIEDESKIIWFLNKHMIMNTNTHLLICLSIVV